MKSEDLKNSILQMAMKGKLVPQDPNDEPASVLLERIHKEKEQLIKDKKIKRNNKESFIFRKNNHFYEKIGKNGEPKCIDDEIPFEVPENWELSRLGSICKLINVNKIKGPKYPYLQVKYLRGLSDAKIITEGRFIKKGTTIILVDGENSGEVFKTSENGYMGSTLRLLYIPTNLNEEFILKLIELYKNPLKNNKKGAAIPHLNKNIFNNIILGIPPLKEQKRIVNELEKLIPIIKEYGILKEKSVKLNSEFPDKLKESILQEAIQGKLVPQDPNDEPASVLLEKIHKEKEQLIKDKKIKRNNKESFIYKENNHFYEKIGKNGEPKCIDDEIPFEVPKNWEWCRLGFIGNWISGATPKRTKSKYYNNGTIPWLRTGDLNNGFIKEIPEYITDIAFKETSLKLNPIGSVLIAMYGATIGKLGILTIPATTNQACCACLPYNGIYNKFLFYFLMSQNKNFNKMSEGGAQPNISKEKIINYLFPLPPIDEQKRIVKKIRSILILISKIKTP